MTRNEVERLLIEALREIQAQSGRGVPEITDETRPLKDLPGFDSHNDLEVAVELAEPFQLDEKMRLCLSDDGTRPLSIREIVDRIMAHMTNPKGTTDE